MNFKHSESSEQQNLLTQHVQVHLAIANNSGQEPAVGTQLHNKMSVNMATHFIKKCMEGV